MQSIYRGFPKWGNRKLILQNWTMLGFKLMVLGIPYLVKPPFVFWTILHDRWPSCAALSTAPIILSDSCVRCSSFVPRPDGKWCFQEGKPVSGDSASRCLKSIGSKKCKRLGSRRIRWHDLCRLLGLKPRKLGRLRRPGSSLVTDKDHETAIACHLQPWHLDGRWN